MVGVVGGSAGNAMDTHHSRIEKGLTSLRRLDMKARTSDPESDVPPARSRSVSPTSCSSKKRKNLSRVLAATCWRMSSDGLYSRTPRSTLPRVSFRSFSFRLRKKTRTLRKCKRETLFLSRSRFSVMDGRPGTVTVLAAARMVVRTPIA